jgi:preprotein translocase subunit SecA
MSIKLLKKIFGTRNERVVKRLSKIVDKINELEPSLKPLTDDELRAKTTEYRKRFEGGALLDDLLPEAFALVREASVRTIGLRPFDVQMIGGMVLHQGKIAEMRTGEGKTLVATLPAYLNAITGKNVNIVTVNDYLAKRDANWMGPIYNFLGLTVGVIASGQSYAEKKAAYGCDITYGTNNEFGFDYLRDNMVFSLEEKVQRNLYYAIVDEVDSILIDEARTPLIISGPTSDSSDLYLKINAIIPKLKKQEKEGDGGDFVLDEKIKQAYLTEEGHEHVEELLSEIGLIGEGESLYDVRNIKLMHHLNALLRAHALYHRDVDYIVKNGEVIIVDEHTGRTMEGRRWSDGLHQAVEAKEGVTVQNENQTLATITFQNYFRLYQKLAGMTGTADTEAYEFQHIYGLEVVVIPTHMTMIRKDFGDQIYLTTKEKFNAVIEDIKTCLAKEQPVLVGTASIEASEKLSAFLTKEKIGHQVLNAKHHEREAKIIAEAGQPKAVTISTNMAGRGTDIVLGGNLDMEIAALQEKPQDLIDKMKREWQQRHEKVVASGGLHVIGSERHESRRIDNQLRGRSGRQGDPGSSRFYLSLEDNLMRIFASDRVAGIMKRLGMKENEAIEHPLITRAVENAQRKVEGHNFDIRKHLLEYDDVANEQRKVVYSMRDDLMESVDISEIINEFREDVISKFIDKFIPQHSLEEQWDIPGLELQLQQDFNLKLPLKAWLNEDAQMNEEILRGRILEEAVKAYKAKEMQVDPEVLRDLEKSIMLQSLDVHWKEHLAAMDHLRQGIHLRGYAQQNPKQEYKRVSFVMFEEMVTNVKHDVISMLSTMTVKDKEEVEAVEEDMRSSFELQKMNFIHASAASVMEQEAQGEEAGSPKQNEPVVRAERKVGRNELCPCGSGKKYKHCHGRIH